MSVIIQSLSSKVAKSKSCAFPAFLALRNKASKPKDAWQRIQLHIADSLKWQYIAKCFIESL
jgi:hypothetical protein